MNIHKGTFNVLLPPQVNQKFNTRWTTEEQLLAVQGGFLSETSLKMLEKLKKKSLPFNR